MTLQQSNSGPRRSDSGAIPSDTQSHPAAKMTSGEGKAQPTGKLRLNADSANKSVVVSERAAQSGNPTGVTFKGGSKPESFKTTPSNCQKTNDGESNPSRSLAGGKSTSPTSCNGCLGATPTAFARGVQQVDHVDASRKEKEKKNEALPLPNWREEMGIVLGKPIVKKAICKQTQRSVENASKPTLHAWTPSVLKPSPVRFVEDESKQNHNDDHRSQPLDGVIRDLVIKDELDSQNARIRAHLVPVLPDYRILNLLPKLIEQRLMSEPDRCTASVLSRAPPHDRCKKLTFHRAEVIEVPQLLEDLKKLDVRAGEWPKIRTRLSRLTELSLCKWPHASKAKETLRTLDIQLAQWLHDSTHSEDLEGTFMLLEKALMQISNERSISELRKHLDQLYDSNQLTPSSPQQVSPKRYSKKTMPAAIPSFAPYEPHNDRLQYDMSGNKYQATSRILNTPLADKELDAKYMYIYWFKGKPEYIKIGVSHDVSRRLRSWQDNCGHSDCEHSLDERLEYPIKHAFRVERLVHAALKDFRCQTDKCGCGGYHTEWFRADVELALKIIKIFTDFMNEQPYAFDREIKAVCLKRTRKIRQRCAEMLQAMEELVPDSPAASKI
ncbi:hypothetical protein KEM54_002003 [Ascosphaera aggregata]|nr:hypothetical protein KEM54_002003 [Ascosphaera aggregata]